MADLSNELISQQLLQQQDDQNHEPPVKIINQQKNLNKEFFKSEDNFINHVRMRFQGEEHSNNH